MKHAKNIFASVTGLALIGASGAALANSPPQFMHPVPGRPCCAGQAAQVRGWIAFKTGSHAPSTCNAIYLKFDRGNAFDSYARGFGNAASGKCYYKLNLAGVKGPTAGTIYMKYARAAGPRSFEKKYEWGVGKSVRVDPHEYVTVNYMKLP